MQKTFRNTSINFVLTVFKNSFIFVFFCRMELVWHGEFDRLFTQYYPHAWQLVPTFCPPNDRWRTFKDSAKVRFSCQVRKGQTNTSFSPRQKAVIA